MSGSRTLVPVDPTGGVAWLAGTSLPLVTNADMSSWDGVAITANTSQNWGANHFGFVQLRWHDRRGTLRTDQVVMPGSGPNLSISDLVFTCPTFGPLLDVTAQNDGAGGVGIACFFGMNMLDHTPPFAPVSLLAATVNQSVGISSTVDVVPSWTGWGPIRLQGIVESPLRVSYRFINSQGVGSGSFITVSADGATAAATPPKQLDTMISVPPQSQVIFRLQNLDTSFARLATFTVQQLGQIG